MIAAIGLGVIGIASGIGLFKGIIASTPEVNIQEIAPMGQSTIIYDSEGKEIDKYVSSNSNRIIVTMDKIPLHLAHAFVAIEDERFYTHNGVDIKGMVRSAYQFFKTKGAETQGASTITQQLLKNLVFTDWTSEGDNLIKKVKRKLQEQYLAMELTKVTTKDEVLLQYMNVINMGQNTLGVEAASQRYFGKSCSELTLSECAAIASITQNPSSYNPISHPDRNVKRRKACLDKMLELGFITDAEYEEAIADTEALYSRIGNNNDEVLASNSERGSYFSDALQKQVLDDMIHEAGYSETIATSLLLSGGLRIYSTLDPKIQAIADEEAANAEHYPENVNWYLNYALTVYGANGDTVNYSQEAMTTYFQENVDKKFSLIFSSQEAAQEAIGTFKAAVMREGDTFEETVTMTPQPQISLTILDQATGYVKAIVGGRGAKSGRLTLNRATDTVRQPGSTFKVVSTYAPALDSAGLTLASVYNDAPFNYASGTPVNNWYDGYRGINSLRTGISQSMNILTVKALTQITPQLCYDYLLNFGFTTLVARKEVNGLIYSDISQSLALGGITDGVTNLELCSAYATIANGGIRAEPKLYTKVVDSDGNVILDNTAPKTRQVIKATTAYLLTSAMVDAVTTGTGASTNFGGMAMAGKTGTTTKTVDVWFAGYTPYYTCTVWTGYDNNQSLNTGATNNESNISKKLWKAVMSRIHEALPREQFMVPEGIIQRTVCSRSGKLPIPGLCDGSCTTEFFAAGTEPTETCDVHYQGTVCQYDGLPASDECPFKAEGILELPLLENPVLYSGYPEGTVYSTTNRCQHNLDFLLQPDSQAIIEQQRIELQQRHLGNQAAEAEQTAPPAAP